MPMTELLEILGYPFVWKAFAAGAMIAVCASVLGVVLVLKHYSLIGHGLSEVGFASLSIASALGLPVMLVSAPAVIAASFVIMYVSQRFRTAGDIAIAVASSAALAAGVAVSSLTGQFTAMNSYLFGSVLAVSDSDMYLAAALSVIVLGVFVIFYNRIFLITYNEDYARSLGI
ncbi:MAG: metal ABC transporter permease, partial [Synergistaceae bacterium]|nr:metal ABC transporter permease [Synergistaceae bacterium]